MGMFGESDEERKIRERAEARQKQYETETGEAVPEEAGIEEDTTLEDMAMGMMGPAGALKKAGQFAVGQAKGKVMGKLRENVKGAMDNQQKQALKGVGTGHSQPKYDIEAKPGVISYTKKSKF